MFQNNKDDLFNGMPNVFSIAKDILTAGFDELVRDNNAKLHKVLRIYRQANLKFNKDKCFFRCTGISFLKSNFVAGCQLGS